MLAPVSAQLGSVGISGPFYRYEYNITPGGVISGPSIYVLVYNPTDTTYNMTMEAEIKPKTPLLQINFSEDKFTLKPKESKAVYITIRALPEALPGDYDVYVGAYAEVKTPEKGIKVVPVGALHSVVHVVGETSRVTVTTVDIYGNHVPAEIRLISAGGYIIATTYNGTLEAVVAPGEYEAAALLQGTLLNSTKFTVEPGEWKKVVLVVNTVYFSYFNVVPAVDKEGNIGYAYVVAVVRNLFKPLPNSTILLKVWLEGKPIENVTVSTVPLLPKGDSEYKYNYIPKDGWKTGTYEFQMLLYSEGKLYAFTAKKQLKVQAGKVVTGKPAPLTISALAGVAVSVTAAIIFLIVFFRRRKRKELLEKIYRNLKDAEETIKECSEMLKEIDETLRRW